MSFKMLVNSDVLNLRFIWIIVNLGGANSDLSSHHLHIDGSKGSKTTVNLLKSLKDSTWYGRGVSVLSSLVINIISCNYIGDNGQSATIATDRPQEVFMKLVNLRYQKEQYYNHLRQYYHNKLLIHQQIQM